MKQACCRPRANGVAVRIILLVAGLLLLAGILAACGKKSASEETKEQKDGYTLTTEPAQSLPGKVLQKAKGTECQENLKQIRMALDSEKSGSEEGTYPHSLSSLDYPKKSLRCPVSKEDYMYDPATGQVHCTFPGHESF